MTAHAATWNAVHISQYCCKIAPNIQTFRDLECDTADKCAFWIDDESIIADMT